MTVYSHSRLNTFENCPKQFQFRYVLKIPQESEGIEAFVGKRVHEVLERLYEFVDRDQVPPLQKVVDRYYQLFDEHFDPGRIRIVKTGVDVPFYRELGSRCLNNYYRKHYPFDVDETLGIEERVVFELDELGAYKMQGIIDRIARAPDGAIEIIDYKTGAWVPNQDKIDKDRQLALYQIGLQKVYGPQQPIRLVWHYVAKNITRTSERTDEQLESLKRETIDIIDAIQRETAYEPKKSRLCDWCEYKSICPLFQETNELSPPKASGSPSTSGEASGSGAKADESGAAATPKRPAPIVNREGQLNLL